MRVLASVRALSTTAALVFLVACAGGSVMALKPASPQEAGRFQFNQARRVSESYDRCPAKGRLVYVSDYENSVIYIYSGKFTTGNRCGKLSGTELTQAFELFVDYSTHDLYVTTLGGSSVFVFHRGASTPYNTYTDPSGQLPVGVAVASDGTVLASNETQPGSISTWIGGPNGGQFVGTFPIGENDIGRSITVGKGGTVYYSDSVVPERRWSGRVWRGRCPLGKCGRFYVTGARARNETILRTVDDGDLVQMDGEGHTLTTYESFPNGVSCHNHSFRAGLDIDKSQKHFFYTDNVAAAVEMSYPGCTVISTVRFGFFEDPTATAVDP